MPYHVVKHGNQFCVEKKATGKSFGCHPTREEANKQLSALYANEPKAARKNLILRAATGTFRTATFRDEEYIVVPVVALVEGVIWPVNAETPELVLEEEFAVAPGGWNGRPVFCGHPVRDGEEVSGNTPEILEEEQIGYVFNAKIDNHRLTMEAWISPTMCETAGDAALNTLERAKTGEPIEISTGVLVVSEQTTGSYQGKRYYSIWRDITPDHLALLHEGDEGACSIEMGCGVRAATAHIITAGGIVRAMRHISQEQRDKIPADQFAGKDKSYPIEIPQDVEDAVHAIGRAGSENDSTGTIKSNIINIAYKLGDKFVAKLPNDWKHKADQKAAKARVSKHLLALVKKLRGAAAADDAEEAGELIAYSTMSALVDQAGITLNEAKDLIASLIADETENPAETPEEEAAEETVENARLDSLYALIGSVCDVMYKVSSLVSGCLMDDYVDSQAMYPRYMAKKDTSTVQAVHDTAVMLGATCDEAGMKAAAGHSCSCGQQRNNQQGVDMKDKVARITALMSNEHNPLKDKAALEALPDASLEALEAHCVAAKKTVDDAATARQTLEGKVNDLIAASAKKPTQDEMLAQMPEVKSIVDRYNAGRAARKTELVTKLKANATVAAAYTEDELKAMDVEALEKLAKASSVDVAVTASSAHVDFSGRSVPAATPVPGNEAPPAAPDFSAQLRTQGGSGFKKGRAPQQASA